MNIKIRRYVRINAKGKKLYKFIDLIRENNISCRSQYCRNEVFHGDFLYRDLKKLQSIAEDNGIDLKTAEYESLFARLYRYRCRIGIIFGILIAITAACYFSQVVVTIEINGNSSISDEIILAALAELDIKEGTPLHNIDLRRCEKKLRLMIDDIAWVGIRHTGSRVVVQIREVSPVPDMVNDHIPCNIIASHDAEITHVLVRKGRTIHAVGDYVPKGTLLVSGVTEDEKGRNHLCHAMGEIRGIYEETVRFSGTFQTEEMLATGETDKQSCLKLFSLELPLSFGRNKFSASTNTTSEHSLKLFGKILPIGVRSTTFIETRLTENTLTEEELSAKLMERVYLYEKNFLSDDTDILDRSITTEKNPETLTLCVKYKLEGNIAEQRELMIK